MLNTVKEVLKKYKGQVNNVHLKDKHGYPIGDWDVDICKKNFKYEEVAETKIAENSIEIRLKSFC